jgi:hypothetical protein
LLPWDHTQPKFLTLDRNGRSTSKNNPQKYFMKKLLLLPLAAALAALSCSTSFAAALASDNAADSAYSGGWASGSNGGTGFGVWAFASGGTSFSGRYIGSTGQGNPSFGLYADNTGGSTYTADRPFTGGALAIGQTFSIDLGHTSFVSAGGNIGINFLAGSTPVFTVKSVYAGTDWQLNDGGSDFGTGQSDLIDTSYHFTFTVNSAHSYSYTLGGASATINTAVNDMTTITGVRLFNSLQGPGMNSGYNNLAIVPEPATYAMLLGGAGLMAFVRRRRS